MKKVGRVEQEGGNLSPGKPADNSMLTAPDIVVKQKTAGMCPRGGRRLMLDCTAPL